MQIVSLVADYDGASFGVGDISRVVWFDGDRGPYGEKKKSVWREGEVHDIVILWRLDHSDMKLVPFDASMYGATFDISVVDGWWKELDLHRQREEIMSGSEKIQSTQSHHQGYELKADWWQPHVCGTKSCMVCWGIEWA